MSYNRFIAESASKSASIERSHRSKRQ